MDPRGRLAIGGAVVVAASAALMAGVAWTNTAALAESPGVAVPDARVIVTPGAPVVDAGSTQAAETASAADAPPPPAVDDGPAPSVDAPRTTPVVEAPIAAPERIAAETVPAPAPAIVPLSATLGESSRNVSTPSSGQRDETESGDGASDTGRPESAGAGSGSSSSSSSSTLSTASRTSSSQTGDRRAARSVRAHSDPRSQSQGPPALRD